MMKKKQTKSERLDERLDELNDFLNLKKGTIHAYRAYNGTLLATGTNDILYGVERMSDGKMIDVVDQIISVVKYSIKPFDSLIDVFNEVR